MTVFKHLASIFFLLFLGLLLPIVVFAAATCKGYQSGSKTVESGICYYALQRSDNPNYTTDGTQQDCGVAITCAALPSCSSMTANDYHKSSAFHGITDEVQNCRTYAIDPSQTMYKCCAPNNQNNNAPPPPCTLDANGKCNQVSTAIGNIGVNPGTIVGDIFGVLLGLAGGSTIAIIMVAGYKIMFSRGDPESLKGAREQITSAIIGLLFLIFSVAILRVIGVNIFHIPGFNQ